MAHMAGEVPIRAKARLVRTLLGDEMVSNEVVALVELVKNAYDADAKKVKIVIQPEQGQILVMDDGHGMSHDTILEVWTSPATLYKKKRLYSRGGRRLLGNKGIGRFASFRLGNRLEVTSRELDEKTKRPGETETTLAMDWTKLLADDELYLDQVTCKWERGEPDEFGLLSFFRMNELDSLNGTLLRITELAQDVRWDHKRLAELVAGLSRLIPPGDAPGFSIDLVSPVLELNGPVQSPEVLFQPDYSISGTVDQHGVARLEFTGPGQRLETIMKHFFVSLDSTAKWRSKKGANVRVPTCGALLIEMRVWDRDRDALQEKSDKFDLAPRDLKDLLDRMTGVSVYRDGFRVFPFGEAGNDWLRLDLRRVQNPTLRLSNNQVIGLVRLGSDSNPNIKDQSNREGFIQSLAVSDLMEVISQVANELEVRRYAIRRKHFEPLRAALFSGIDLNFLREQLALNRITVSPQLAKLLDQQERELSTRVKKIQEAYTRYRRLSHMGVLVDRVLHQTLNPLGKIDSATNRIKRSIETVSVPEIVHNSLDRITMNAQIATQALKDIAPFSGKRRRNPQPYEIEDIIRQSFNLAEVSGIKTIVSATKNRVVVDEADMLQVFTNLIYNSVYWLEDSHADQPVILVSVETRDEEVEIYFCDNGPGVDEEFRDTIFEPYFSLKPEGTGLGLAIVGEIVMEYSGKLDLVYEGAPLSGACFRITLPLEESKHG
jgi:signal transduction histidine kinase